ncbi:hypothetical protein UFOVP747_40 [uncultured Caudovirales phage]|uniref:Uncharacterized protein n=1 Tax=uncultured Caudovirales phage TaxID=2100421 RepID=A0A6J7X4G4_9CAUD|nr:hypothetical protein UFOVP675_59 [uncultured Caudovirales phage]CAB5225517.1 hypothetical protein UFOVP747_40 [uncultured Caudovirales phage]
MTAGNWPFPEQPGVPLNPERDGWHWVNGTPRKWDVWDEGSTWEFAGCFYKAMEWAHRTYGGVCLTPAEHQAALDACWKAACEAMREACVSVVNDIVCPELFVDMAAADAFDQAGQIALNRMCALPTPERPQ